jgi:hypothetical protein
MKVKKLQRKRYNSYKLDKISGMLDSGMTTTAIVHRLKMQPSTVRGMRQRYLKFRTLERRPVPGRPRVTSGRTDRAIARAVRKDRFISARQIKQVIGLADISEDTICNRISELCGYSSLWSVHKPFVSEANRQKRLDFASKYSNKPVAFWRRVVWSDESAYCYIMKGKERVWRLPNERYSTECTIATVKHDKKVLVWGCFSASGVGNLHLIEGILNARRYVNILSTQLLPSLTRLSPDGNFIFQQDNDPKHTADTTQAWLRTKHITVLDWPPQSPDLNPIENLWSFLDQRAKLRRPNSDEELFDTLKQCWCAIDEDILRNLADSMPRRLQAVIDNNGWQTKY